MPVDLTPVPGGNSRVKWVRPIISMAMAGAVIYGFVVGKIPWEGFSAIATATIGWWFYARSKEKGSSEV